MPKICNSCKNIKDAFRKDPRTKDGLGNICSDCLKTQREKRRISKPNHRQYNKNNQRNFDIIKEDTIDIFIKPGIYSTIDKEDYPTVKGYYWLLSIKKCGIWVRAIVNEIDYRKTIFLHRIIMNPPENMEIDHKDHNGLNNKKDNLRLATRKDNAHNRRNFEHTSIYKGVFKYRNNWRASIRVNCHKIYLGDFFSEIEAAKAYNEAALKHFGEFALINNI